MLRNLPVTSSPVGSFVTACTAALWASQNSTVWPFLHRRIVLQGKIQFKDMSMHLKGSTNWVLTTFALQLLDHWHMHYAWRVHCAHVANFNNFENFHVVTYFFIFRFDIWLLLVTIVSLNRFNFVILLLKHKKMCWKPRVTTDWNKIGFKIKEQTKLITV